MNQCRDVLQVSYLMTIPFIQWSVTEMLQRLNWQTLAHCRDHFKAIAVFKILHDLIDIPDTYLTLASSGYHTRGQSMKLQQPTARILTLFHQDLDCPTWGVSATTLNQFKNKLAGQDWSFTYVTTNYYLCTLLRGFAH